MFRNLLVLSALACAAGATLSAQPRLRLEIPPEVTRPHWIAVGTNGPADLAFEAYNVGDGQFDVQADGGLSPWLVPIVNPPFPCSFDILVNCRRVQVTFAAAGLAPGAYEGEIVVRSPGAIDAPQTLPIKVYVGGNVPERIDLYLPTRAGATDFQDFQTPAGPAPALTAVGELLAASSSNLGSFRVLHTHRLLAEVGSAAIAAGDREGTLTVAGSSFPLDNRDVPVSVHVTDGPIVQLSARRLVFEAVPGFVPSEQFIAVSNRGSGELTLGEMTAAAETGGDWLSVEDAGGGFLRVRVASEGVPVGLHRGTIDLTSNAANSPTQITVLLAVRAVSSPLTFFRGVVNGATFNPDRALAPGLLSSVFGRQFTLGIAVAENLPLPTELAGASVLIDGVQAPLVFVSFGQINFQVPWEIQPGERLVQIMRNGQPGNQVSVQVESRSPGLFRFGIAEYGAIRNASQGNFPLPSDFSRPGFLTAPARPGDVLEIFATGLGPVTPPTVTGEAALADPLSSAVEVPTVNFGRTSFGPLASPQFIGLTPEFVGLFQVNVIIPDKAPSNVRTFVTLEYQDGRRSNTVEIAIER